MATHAAARRQGGARAVLQAIEANAIGAGCTTLYLQAEAANTAALALYRAGKPFHAPASAPAPAAGSP